MIPMVKAIISPGVARIGQNGYACFPRVTYTIPTRRVVMALTFTSLFAFYSCQRMTRGRNNLHIKHSLTFCNHPKFITNRSFAGKATVAGMTMANHR
jgi:hypothetical protein